VTFPSPPWDLRGQAWVSLFRATEPGGSPGAYAVGWVDYQPPGTLAYRELLVAKRVTRTALSVIDLWVDSPSSAEGGRALWALPKELGELSLDDSGLGLVARAEWSATSDGRPVASASFADTSKVAVRLPIKASVRQPRNGSEVETSLSGSGRSLPCLAHWEFAAEGPLGWLTGKQPVVSARVRDFSVSFG
jgi:acetoacetate decarboxylase